MHSEIIAHGRRDIETGAFVQIGFGSFITKDILPVIGAERSCVLPLRINGSVTSADCDPTAFASRNRWALVRFLKPWNNPRGFRPMSSSCLVAVRKRAVKWILPGREFYGDIITPMRGIGIIKPTVIFGPIFV